MEIQGRDKSMAARRTQNRVPENNLSAEDRNKLVTAYMPYAIKVANQHRHMGERYGVSIEELVSGCFYGLVEAAKRWNPDKAPYFHYAKWWVLCHARRTIYEQQWFGTNGVGHTGGDRRVGAIPPKRVYAYKSSGLDLYDDNVMEINTLEFLTRIEGEEPEGDVNTRWDNLLAPLAANERQAISLRFRDGATLTESAAAMGVCRERVRQIQERALKRIRAWITDRLCRSMMIAGIDEDMLDLIPSVVLRPVKYLRTEHKEKKLRIHARAARNNT